ncbi:MAG: PTS sugar transporter subunit IIA [Desulfatibacillaceae bacterium]
MKIYRFLKKGDIYFDLPLETKEDILCCVATAFVKNGSATDEDSVLAGLREREEVMSTGIGMGIAIPHTACPAIGSASMVVLRLVKPVEYGSVDGRPVDLVLAMVCPEKRTGLHLRMLAAMARLCRTPEFAEFARSTRNPEEFLGAMRSLEESMAFH